MADQLVKWVVRANADRLPYRILPWARIELAYNSGISFSRFADAGWIVTALVGAVAATVTAALLLAPPRYRLTARSGPDHAPSFELVVEIEGFESATGTGASKRAAEQAAAAAFMAREGVEG